MKISRLNTRITFQRCMAARDKYGNQTNKWTDVFETWAAINTDAYGSEERGAVVSPSETINFTTRWCTELDKVTSTSYRILCRGSIYDIIFVNHMGYRNNSLRFVCHLEKEAAPAGAAEGTEGGTS